MNSPRPSTIPGRAPVDPAPSRGAPRPGANPVPGGGLRDPHRAVRLLIAAYMAGTLPLALAGARWGDAPFVLVHLAALVALLIPERLPSLRYAVPVLWLPLILVPVLYAEAPLLMRPLHDGFGDAAIVALEGAIFGSQPARELAGTLPWLLASEIVHLGYLSYYPLIYLPSILLFVSGRHREMGETILAIMTAFTICIVAFLIFPVEGPRYAWPAPPGVPDGPVRRLVLFLLEGGSSRGTAFPSLHMSMAVAQTIMALRHQRTIGFVAAFLTILLAAGAVYGGFHYAVDILAGALIGALAAALAILHASAGATQRRERGPS